ncbi:MAG TPA: FAD:protein FMN transferase [Planctomycetota bacterium]|nr:FAD:protein FMN transferase [Planctomycetota bacterium]
MVVLALLRSVLATALACGGACLPAVCSALQTQAASPASSDSPRLAQALARAFPDADAFTTRTATLDDAQRASLTPRLRGRQAPRLWTYREARTSKQLQGRAIEGDVIGKSLPITYLVILDADNRVRGIEILEYRESHGGEVRREKWRAQFQGKGAQDELKLGSDIRNIAGATLSCRALTDAVHDALAIATLVFADEQTIPTVSTALPPARLVAGDKSGSFARTQLLMGTLLELRAVTSDRASFDAAADAAFARVATLEALWSTWRADSEISRLNASEPGTWCAISPASCALLERAAILRTASAGAFAAEAGALVELWRAAEASQREPTAEQNAAARAACAVASFELDSAKGRARRTDARARLDLGGIGKGAALDEIAQEFRSRGLSRALFDFGGQFLALDGPREGAGWPIEIRDPRPAALAPLWELELSNASLATSADDQRGLAIAGLRRSHIVDPRSGEPADAHWAACVWAANATDADAWSTAAFVLDHAALASLAERRELRILTFERDGTLWMQASFPGHGRGP